MQNNTRQKTLWLTETAILMAIVIVLQLIGGMIRIGTVSISLVLIPIVVGAMLQGPLCGAVLGLTFGVITVIGGLNGTDAFTAILLQSGAYSAIMTVLLCLVKATLAGLVPGLIYKALKARHSFIASVLASISAPIVNTGLFIAGAYFLLYDPIFSNFAGPSGSTMVYFLFIACAGINFLVEFALNAVFSPAIHYFVATASKGKLGN